MIDIRKFELYSPETHPKVNIRVDILDPVDDQRIANTELIPGISVMTGMLKAREADLQVLAGRYEKLEFELVAERLRREVAELTLQKERLQKEVAA